MRSLIESNIAPTRADFNELYSKLNESGGCCYPEHVVAIEEFFKRFAAVPEERRIEEMLKDIINADDSNSGCEPSISVLYRSIDVAREYFWKRSPMNSGGKEPK